MLHVTEALALAGAVMAEVIFLHLDVAGQFGGLAVKHDPAVFENIGVVRDRERVRMWREAPEAVKSVINFGIPSLTGASSSGVDNEALEKAVADAIYAYEPRLIPGTVTVKSVRGVEQMSLNALMFEIEADLWAQPVPLHLYLQTEVDLETGHFSTARQLP